MRSTTQWTMMRWLTTTIVNHVTNNDTMVDDYNTPKPYSKAQRYDAAMPNATMQLAMLLRWLTLQCNIHKKNLGFFFNFML